MKTTLHKLPSGFIITSDEQIKEGDYMFFDGIILKLEKNESPKNRLKVIAQQDQIDFSSLLEEEQKKIGLI